MRTENCCRCDHAERVYLTLGSTLDNRRSLVASATQISNQALLVPGEPFDHPATSECGGPWMRIPLNWLFEDLSARDKALLSAAIPATPRLYDRELPAPATRGLLSARTHVKDDADIPELTWTIESWDRTGGWYGLLSLRTTTPTDVTCGELLDAVERHGRRVLTLIQETLTVDRHADLRDGLTAAVAALS